MRKFIEYFAVALCAIMISAGIQQCDKPEGKYTVYAAGNKYSCNHFTISGKTIYFDDLDNNRVFINGEFTLIYEKDKDQD